MSTCNLHGCPAYPDDCVFDSIDGAGIIKAVESNCLYVKVGRCTRKYTCDGFTGKRHSATLFWHQPPKIIFAKDDCTVKLQRKVIEDQLKMLQELAQMAQCCEPKNPCPTQPCCKPQPCCPPDPCEPDPLLIEPIIKEWK